MKQNGVSNNGTFLGKKAFAIHQGVTVHEGRIANGRSRNRAKHGHLLV